METKERFCLFLWISFQKQFEGLSKGKNFLDGRHFIKNNNKLNKK
jgi:hypothetical protein